MATLNVGMKVNTAISLAIAGPGPFGGATGALITMGANEYAELQCVIYNTTGSNTDFSIGTASQTGSPGPGTMFFAKGIANGAGVQTTGLRLGPGQSLFAFVPSTNAMIFVTGVRIINTI